jgi:SAM-dependent methyltransferase
LSAFRFPPGFFERSDPEPDTRFYSSPRFVNHIDDATIDALTQFYRERLVPGSSLLDLMSSWVSHLPPEVSYARVAGLGMNGEELAANPRLTDWVVRDLNLEPALPYGDASFDAVLNAVSVQYLTRPVEVFAEVRRVLAPGGLHVVATSHRLFPTKAVHGWQALPTKERMRLIALYFREAGGYAPADFVDRSPRGADPLWIVCARKVTPGEPLG